MEIVEIKEKMKEYTDIYGGSFLDISEINEASTFIELAGIIDRHSEHIESMERDAQSNLAHFKQRLGLGLL